MKKRTLLGLMASLPMSSVLTACGGSDSNGGASVRLVNASPGYDSLDLYVEDTLEISGVEFGTASSFNDVTSGDVTTALTRNGSATELLTQTRSFSKDKSYSVVAYGWEGDLKSVAILEDEDAADSGESSISILHTATDAGSLDIYLTGEDDDLDSSTPVASSVDGGSRSSFNTVDAGTYRLRVTAEDDTTDVRLDISGVTVESKGVYTVVLVPTSGGLLVDALMLQQEGDLTPLLNTQARVRLVANMAGGVSVGMSVAGTRLASAATSPTITEYVKVTAGSVTVNTSVGGSSLAASTFTVPAGADVTFLVTGSSASDAEITMITDDNRLPTSSTKYKIRLLHGSNLLASESLTLTIDLSDAISNQTFQGASSYVSKTSSSDADVTVNTLSSTTAVVDLTGDNSVSLAAKGVYTLFVYDTAAGATTGKLKKER